ncbi:Calcium release-activated calcium channel protein [Trinorchestia longiramus]|nr:Calcium release-activated calcium channel protein [Trinorchestia longiramus]
MTTSVAPSAQKNVVLMFVNPEGQLEPRRLFLARSNLKASSQASALLAGFAMVAMVEMDLKEGLPIGLMVAFTICTLLLISVHLMALMISTCLGPFLDVAVSKVRHKSSDRIKLFLHNVVSNCQTPLLEEEIHENDFSQPHLLMRSKGPQLQFLGLFYLVHFGDKGLSYPSLLSSPSKQNCKGNGKQFHKNRVSLEGLHAATDLRQGEFWRTATHFFENEV